MSLVRRLSRPLGALSLALGAVQLLLPRRFSNAIGVDRSPSLLVRAIGLREIGAGVGLLGGRRPVPVLWSRVFGDVMDLVIVAFSWRPGGRLSSDGPNRGRLAATTAALFGITAADVASAAAASRTKDPAAYAPTSEKADRDGIVRVRKAVTVDRSLEDTYAFWRNLENLPRFMRHLESVRVIDERRSVWRAWAPGGTTVKWIAEITEDRPNERLAWRSVEGSQVRNAGTVTFTRATGDRGTVVTAELEYDPPAGSVGARIARLFGEEPTQQVPEDLRRFKQVIETGEVVVSEATRVSNGLKQRAAQPQSPAGIREASSSVVARVAHPIVSAATGGNGGTGDGTGSAAATGDRTTDAVAPATTGSAR